MELCTTPLPVARLAALKPPLVAAAVRVSAAEPAAAGQAVAPPQPSPLSMEWSPFPIKGQAGGSGGFFGSGFTAGSVGSHPAQVPAAFCDPAPSARCDPDPALRLALLVPSGPASTLMPAVLVPPSGLATSSQPGSAWGHVAALPAGLVTEPQQKPHHQPVEQAISGSSLPVAPSHAPIAAGLGNRPIAASTAGGAGTDSDACAVAPAAGELGAELVLVVPAKVQPVGPPAAAPVRICPDLPDPVRIFALGSRASLPQLSRPSSHWQRQRQPLGTAVGQAKAPLVLLAPNPQLLRGRAPSLADPKPCMPLPAAAPEPVPIVSPAAVLLMAPAEEGQFAMGSHEPTAFVGAEEQHPAAGDATEAPAAVLDSLLGTPSSPLPHPYSEGQLEPNIDWRRHLFSSSPSDCEPPPRSGAPPLRQQPLLPPKEPQLPAASRLTPLTFAPRLTLWASPGDASESSSPSSESPSDGVGVGAEEASGAAPSSPGYWLAASPMSGFVDSPPPCQWPLASFDSSPETPLPHAIECADEGSSSGVDACMPAETPPPTDTGYCSSFGNSGGSGVDAFTPVSTPPRPNLCQHQAAGGPLSPGPMDYAAVQQPVSEVQCSAPVSVTHTPAAEAAMPSTFSMVSH